MMIEHQTCVCLSFSSVCKTSIELLVLSTPYPCLFLHNKVLCPRLADEERRKSVKFFVFVFCVRMWECFTYAPSIQRMIWSMWNSKILNLRWIIKRKVHTRLKCRLKRKTAKHTLRVKGELATALVGGEEKTTTKQGQTAVVLKVLEEMKCWVLLQEEELRSDRNW